ncbi:MAG TPA: DUF177 domain-containing protein [Gaiellaceae bacterium]|nr:DUF177 domain-containing protein [Gaiellaceae bacterium]
MSTFNLRRARLRSGEQLREEVEIALEPFVLGGQEYAPEPPAVRGRLTITKATTGTVFELSFRAGVRGPCFRCLRETVVEESVHAREYQATDARLEAPAARPPAPGRKTGPPQAAPGDDELRNEYLRDDELDLSAWARDALALQLPDKILHAPDCAGLCPVCGKDLNEEPHTHDELAGDPRWAALDELRGQL